jgi:hypothetical protein
MFIGIKYHVMFVGTSNHCLLVLSFKHQYLKHLDSFIGASGFHHSVLEFVTVTLRLVLFFSSTLRLALFFSSPLRHTFGGERVLAHCIQVGTCQ